MKIKKQCLALSPIKAKKPKKYPKNLVFLDTENDKQGDITLYTICDLSYSQEKWSTVEGYFACKESIKKWIEINGESEKQIYAHNMLYDLINLFGVEFILAKFELFFTKSKFIFAKYNKLMFCDTTLLFPMSLKKLGKKVGLEKIETDNFTDKEYNKRDVEILRQAVTKYLEFLKSKNYDFGLTNGSIALKTFRRHFQKESFYFNKQLIDFCKKAYYGGRAENFVKGKIKGTIYVYDVNSLYPYIMSEMIYPDPTHYEITNRLDEYGIYYAYISVKDDYPLIPCRLADRLYFPKGNFETYATGAELIASKCEIIQIYQGIVFKKGKKYFNNFVQTLYKLRLENRDNFLETVIKNIMNSLYGKFGQGNELIVYDKELKDFREETGEYKENSIFPFAIFTTAFSRIYIWNLIKEIQANGGQVYYTDTDSIHTNLEIKNTTLKLGDLKLEGVFSEGEYQAAKQYFLLDKESKKEYIRCKGVPEKYAKLFFKTKYVEFEKPVKLKESINSGEKANVWHKVKKSFLDKENKRNFKDGNSTAIIINQEKRIL